MTVPITNTGAPATGGSFHVASQRTAGTANGPCRRPDDRESVEALSVRELVRRRCAESADPWHLALVQRAKVWDPLRIRHLLDSLLAGYPIGTLLVCRVREASRIIRSDREGREVEDADPEAWQLLDGQQRIHALYCLFTPNGEAGSFYLDVTAERPAASLAGGRGRKAAFLRYIAWRRGAEDDKPVEPRAHYLHLARWYAWAEGAGRAAEVDTARLASDPRTAVETLREIDPAFGDGLTVRQRETAACRLSRLLEVWTTARIPVQRVVIDTPEDLLAVFTRVNLAGVPLAGGDAYFAAVKTWWPRAEHALEAVCERIPVLDRYRALRVFSRLAGRARGRGDPVTPTIDWLARDREQRLLTALQDLVETASPARDRMLALFQTVRAGSRLGAGLWEVHPTLWEPPLAWAAVNGDLAGSDLPQCVGLVDAFLLGGTLFDYPQIFGDAFHRLALAEALQAGLDGEPFPLERIVAATRGTWEELRRGRRVVESLDDAGRLALADENPGLLLRILQRLPFDAEGVDLDHIFPQAQATRMWYVAETGRRRQHQHYGHVWKGGNLWALTAEANRSLQEDPPLSKFPKIDAWLAQGHAWIWPRENWWLSGDERARFEDVDRRLAASPLDIDDAMERFRDLVEERGKRMVEEALRAVPGAKLFAHDVPCDSKERVKPPEIAAALGLASIPDLPSASRSTTSPTREDRFERILSQADAQGGGGLMRAYVALARRLGLRLRVDTGSISLRSPKNGNWSVLYVAPEEGGAYVEYFQPFLDAASEEDRRNLLERWGGKASHVAAREASDWLARLEPVLRRVVADSEA